MAKKQFEPLPESRFVDLPGSLYLILRHYHNEDSQFRKVHRLIDAFEWAIKWHTVLTMSDMLREADLPDEIKVLLSSGLRTPSLGTWNKFFRDSLAAVKSPSAPWSQWERLVALEKKHKIVAFRNHYAHGATPTEEECQLDCEKLYPVLLQLIGSPLFTEVGLIVGRAEGAARLKGAAEIHVEVEMPPGRAGALLPDGQVLDLWPLGVYTRDPKGHKGWGFFYFNALKSSKVEQLNYEKPSIFRDKDMWDPFHEVLPLKEWARIGGTKLDLFRSKIETLTESFKGRLEERKRLKELCLSGRGTRMLWGAPGIGKSTLLAQVFKEIRAGITPDSEDRDVVYPPVIEYFIRRGTEYASRARFLSYLNEKIDRLFSFKNIHVGKNESELWENLVKRLDAIGDMDRRHDLILFIDGLDEYPEITRIIPDSRPWLKVIVSSRPVEAIQDWWRDHDRERRSEETIGPMSENDIRALLYDVADKYQDGFNKIFVEEVEKGSQGNPLYLKLLCDQIYEQGGLVGGIEELPRDMADFYEQTIKRVSHAGTAKNVLTVLRLLTEAKASLSVRFMAAILDELDSQEIKSAIDGCRELLFEDPLTPDVDDYQLFHESLREWLRKHHVRECRAMAGRITDFSVDWTHIDDDEARKYALAHGADHLFDQNDHQRLWTLMKDEEYRAAQVQTFNQYHPAFHAIKNALEMYIRRNGRDEFDDPRLCWLALRAGELGHQAKTDIHDAFEWIRNRPLDDPRRIEDALERLAALDERNFFKAAVFILWLEADRQANLPEAQRKPESVLRILEETDQRIPVGSGTVNWSRFLSIPFMAWWTRRFLDAFPIAAGGSFFRFIDHLNDDGKAEYIAQFEHETKTERFELLLHIAETIQNKTNLFVPIDKFESVSAICMAMAQADGLKNRQSLFHQALTATEAIGDDNEKSKALAAIASAMAQASEFPHALTVAEFIGNDWWKSKALAAIAVAMAQAGEIQQALTSAEAIGDDAEKSKALAAIAAAMAQAGDGDQARICFHQALTSADAIGDDDDKSKALAAIAAAMAQAGDGNQAKLCFQQALTSADAIGDDMRKSKALSTLASALAQADGLKNRQSLFHQALTAADAIGDYNEKCKALSPLASAMAQAGEFPLALTVAELIGNNWWRKSGALAAIAAAMAQAGYGDQARLCFQQALTAADAIGDDIRKSRALSPLASAMAQAGYGDQARLCFQQALTAAEVIRDDRRKSEALSLLASAMAQAEGLENRLSLFQQALTAAEAIGDEDEKSEALSVTHAAMAQAGYGDQAKLCFQKALTAEEAIGDDRRKSEALSAIALAMAQAGYGDQARLCFQRALTASKVIRDDDEQSEVLSAIAAAMAQADGLENRLSLFNQALMAAEAIGDDDEKSEVLSAIAAAMAQAGYVDQARQCFHQALTAAEAFEDDYCKSRVLSAIATAMAQAEGLENRLSLFKQALTAAEALGIDLWKSEALSAIAAAMAQADGLENRETLFHQALMAADAIRDDWRKFGALSAIATTLSRAEDLENRLSLFHQALMAADAIGDDMRKSSALAAIASAMAQAGEIHQALTASEAIGEDNDKSDALAAIASAMAQAGEIHQALTVAEVIGEDRRKSEALSAIASAMAQAEGLENRETLFQQALTAAEAIGEDNDKYTALSAIAAAAMAQADGLEDRVSLFQQALMAADAIRDDWWRKSGALSAIASILAQAGKFQQALMAAETIGDDVDKSEALVAIASTLAQADGLENCESLFHQALAAAEAIGDDDKSKALAAMAAAMAQAEGLENRETLFHQALMAADAIGDDMRKSKALAAMAAAMAQAEGLENRETLFQQALMAADAIGDDMWKSKALAAMAAAMAQAGEEDRFNEYLERSIMPHVIWAEMIPHWQQTLIKYHPARLDLLRHSTGSYIFDHETAWQGVYHVIHGFILNKQFQTVNEIARQCPQLELPFLLDGEEDGRTFANIDDWIHSIDDEDLKEKIEFLAFKVEKGKMTKEAFDQKVADLLP